jgi:hypothetical protein
LPGSGEVVGLVGTWPGLGAVGTCPGLGSVGIGASEGSVGTGAWLGNTGGEGVTWAVTFPSPPDGATAVDIDGTSGWHAIAITTAAAIPDPTAIQFRKRHLPLRAAAPAVAKPRNCSRQ